MSRKKAKKAVKKKVGLLKFGVFPLLSMMFSRWSLHRKVFLLGLSYDSTFPTSVLQVLKMSSWILAPFQMLLLKFRRRSFLLLLLLLLRLLLLLWILLFLNPSIPKRTYLPNSREILN
jgi:hypothetical protein